MRALVVGGLSMRSGFPEEWPGPPGGVNADGRVVDVAGLRIAGLGGSVRYNDGPNQWTQAQQARQARNLVRAAQRRRRRDGRGVDVLLTHAPPRGLGDRDDPPHHGFERLHWTVERLRPGCYTGTFTPTASGPGSTGSARPGFATWSACMR